MHLGVVGDECMRGMNLEVIVVFVQVSARNADFAVVNRVKQAVEPKFNAASASNNANIERV